MGTAFEMLIKNLSNKKRKTGHFTWKFWGILNAKTY